MRNSDHLDCLVLSNQSLWKYAVQLRRRVVGWFVLAVVVMLVGFAPRASGQSGPIVWVGKSLQRVGPDDAAGSGLQAQLYAARGEYESFQIIVRAPSSNSLSNSNVTVSDLSGPGGAVIPRQSLALYREHYVYVGTRSPDWGGSNRPMGSGWYPDGLIPFADPQTGAPITGGTLRAAPFSVNASKNQPIWVDIQVPRTATPGQYSGSFTVTTSQGSVTGQIALTVWNFALPMKPTLKSSFLYWSAGSTAAIQELLRNRIDPANTPTTSQRSLIDSLGLAYQNTGFWSGADLNSCSMSAPPSVSQMAGTVAGQQPDLFLYNYTADEIDRCTNLYPTMKLWARNLHQAGIRNLVTMAPVPELLDDGSGTGRSAVDLWVMLPVVYDRAAAIVRTAQAKGDEAWSYNTLVQDAYSPKWMLDFAPINFRIQPGFINQSLGLTGILYWRIDNWSSDPWNNIYAPGWANYPGESILVYPGSTVGIQGVAPSMRLKWLRDGADDYEYIDLLKKAGRGATALSIAAGVGPNWSSWTRDINALESARLQLGQLLDQLGGGGSTTPGTPGNPNPASGATGVSLTPTLAWSAASGATTYDCYFGTTSPPPFVGSHAATSHSPGALATGTTYYWRVVARNSAGSSSSATWAFTTAQASVPVGAPVNPNPSNGATGVALNPTLSWTAGPGATSHDVYFGTSASPSYAGTTNGISYTAGALTAGTRYYWRVVAKNSSGSATSAIWSFTAAGSSPPPPPPPPSGGRALYGVKFAATGDFAEVAGLNAMNPVVVVGNNAGVDSAIQNARAIRATYPNFKPILWLYPEGWSCTGVNAAGQSFIQHLNSNGYWNDILAIYGLHEPIGQLACGSVGAAVAVADQIRQLSGGQAKLFGKMYSDSSFRGTAPIDGLCDYCGVMYHPFRANPREYRKSQMLTDLARDLAFFKSLAPNKTLNKFTPYLCTIAWETSGVYGTGLYMPSPAEMQDAGSAILNFVDAQGRSPDGLMWYTWANNSTWTGLDLYNIDGDRGSSQDRTGRMGVIYNLGLANPVTPPPSTPAGPNPASGATGVSLTPTLSWSAASGATTYDCYFGTTSPPPLIESHAATTHHPGTLAANTTYYWRVVARNSAGSASSATWSFTTVQAAAPSAPANPSPASGATGVSVSAALGWSAASGATSYDVYFGTTTSPGLVGSTTSTSYNPGTRIAATRYYWRIVAKNSAGSTSSAIWSFTTAAPAAGVPSNPKPADGAIRVSTSTALFWKGVTGSTSYDIYLGTAPDPPYVGRSSATSYRPGTLKASTRYYWRIVSRNATGPVSSSPVWSFTTRASSTGTSSEDLP